MLSEWKKLEKSNESLEQVNKQGLSTKEYERNTSNLFQKE